MMPNQDDMMLWFADRWWWFPGSRIGAEPEFEWRDCKPYLLEPDGNAVEGIVFARTFHAELIGRGDTLAAQH